MGKGREIGAQLHAWLERGDSEPLQSRLLEAMLLDALGSENPRLRGPLRDLAFQPLLLKLLMESSAAVRRSMLDALCQDLRATYSTAVLEELLDLLEAATGLSIGERPQHSAAEAAMAGSPDGAAGRRGATAATRQGRRLHRRSLAGLGAELQPLAPGLALGFANALVMQWLGAELAALLPASWSSGVLLALGLVILQLLALRPLARLRRHALLTLEDSGDPHRAWRWITAPWLHLRLGEALLNGLMLLIILGGTPLPLGSLLLRYLLTSLATMLPAVLLARRWLRAGIWEGATGAVAALIALATGVSLLQWRAVTYPLGVLNVPVWVLFVVYGAIQMGWVLPRRTPTETAPPLRRLLCSCWWWGTAAGLLWALITRLLAWAEPLMRATGQG